MCATSAATCQHGKPCSSCTCGNTRVRSPLPATCASTARATTTPCGATRCAIQAPGPTSAPIAHTPAYRCVCCHPQKSFLAFKESAFGKGNLSLLMKTETKYWSTDCCVHQLLRGGMSLCRHLHHVESPCWYCSHLYASSHHCVIRDVLGVMRSTSTLLCVWVETS